MDPRLHKALLNNRKWIVRKVLEKIRHTSNKRSINYRFSDRAFKETETLVRKENHNNTPDLESRNFLDKCFNWIFK